MDNEHGAHVGADGTAMPSNDNTTIATSAAQVAARAQAAFFQTWGRTCGCSNASDLRDEGGLRCDCGAPLYRRRRVVR